MSSNLRENANFPSATIFSFHGHFENDIIFSLSKKKNNKKLVNVCNKMKNKIHTVLKSNRKSDETEKIYTPNKYTSEETEKNYTPNQQIHVRGNREI